MDQRSEKKNKHSRGILVHRIQVHSGDVAHTPSFDSDRRLCLDRPKHAIKSAPARPT